MSIVYILSVLLRVGLYQSSQSFPAFFTSGDASHYRYARMVAQGKSIPVVDKRVQYPEGLRAREKTAWFMEFFVGYFYRIMPFSEVPFDTYVRLFVPIFSSLSVLALFLVAKEVWGNNLAAIISTLFYAVSLPAIARNVGFAFLKEHFALPLIFFHLYFFLSSIKGGKKYKIILSGLFLFVALGAWHLTQFYFGLLAVFLVINLLLRKDIPFLPYRNFGILVGFAIAGGIIIPYLRASFFIFSYPMLLSYSLLLAWALMRYGKAGRRKAVLAFFLSFLILALPAFFFSPNGKVYSHVYSLILYKIRFLGQKPADPALLPFGARFYWYPDWTTPGLGYILGGFSVLFLVGLFPLGGMVRRLLKGRTGFAEDLLLYFTSTFFVCYLLLQRMEIFLSFFLAVFSGGLIFAARKKVFRRLVIVLILLAFLVEAGMTANQGFGFNNYYLGQLIGWIKENTGKDEVILSSISPSMEILTYTGRPIVLHSFLESRDIRAKIREFAEAIVEGGDEKLYSFCRKYGVNYLVIPRGIYTDTGLYSTRYITNHLGFDARAVGYRLEVPEGREHFNFEYQGEDYQGWMETDSLLAGGDKFGLVFANKEYKVYKVYRQEDIQEAWKHYASGKERFEKRDYETAARELEEAVALYPKLGRAYYYLGLSYYGLGDEKRAVSFLRKARRWDDRRQVSGIRDQGSGIRDQGSGDRGQGTGDRGQGSGDREQETRNKKQEIGGR